MVMSTGSGVLFGMRDNKCGLGVVCSVVDILCRDVLVFLNYGLGIWGTRSEVCEFCYNGIK